MPSREIVTFTGKTFDFMNPRCGDICIEDIAHALALTNRYNGHTRVPYSVAEHCVRMSYMKIGDHLNNLLHDAAEAYIGDIPRPIKQGLCWFHSRTYSHRELMILEVIYLTFGLTFAHSPETKIADNIILATEIRDLMPSNSSYGPYLEDYAPLPGKIKPWSWQTAERKYLSRFEELTQ